MLQYVCLLKNFEWNTGQCEKVEAVYAPTCVAHLSPSFALPFLSQIAEHMPDTVAAVIQNVRIDVKTGRAVIGIDS